MDKADRSWCCLFCHFFFFFLGLMVFAYLVVFGRGLVVSRSYAHRECTASVLIFDGFYFLVDIVCGPLFEIKKRVTSQAVFLFLFYYYVLWNHSWIHTQYKSINYLFFLVQSKSIITLRIGLSAFFFFLLNIYLYK